MGYRWRGECSGCFFFLSPGLGAGAPAGRLYHVALESDGQIQVFDVWESQESFEAFGAALLPILAALGVDPGQPHVSPVHNIIEG